MEGQRAMTTSLDGIAKKAASDTALSDPSVVPVDSGKDLWIYVDTLTLHGTIAIPGGDIKIIARKLKVPSGESATLDITPVPPTITVDTTLRDPAPSAPGASGAKGKPGEHGADNDGQILLVAEQVQLEELNHPGFAKASDGTYVKEVKFYPKDLITLQEACDIAKRMAGRWLPPKK